MKFDPIQTHRAADAASGWQIIGGGIAAAFCGLVLYFAVVVLFSL